MNTTEIFVLLGPAVYPFFCGHAVPLVLHQTCSRIPEQLHLTSTFLAASVLMCSGAALRVACYRTLGRHFTFELALRKDHKLVTSGPYAVVRHPAYTGALMYVAGCVLAVLVDRGSMWISLGLWSTRLGRVLGTSIATVAAVSSFLFISRTRTEDAVLKKEFGSEWASWAKRTRWRLVPYVF